MTRAPILAGESPVIKGVTNHDVANIERPDVREAVKRMERTSQAGMRKREVIEPRHIQNSGGRRGCSRGSQQMTDLHVCRKSPAGSENLACEERIGSQHGKSCFLGREPSVCGKG